MKKLVPKHPLTWAATGGAALLAFSFAVAPFLRAAEKSAAIGAVAPAALAQELTGTWVHVGSPGKVGAAPLKGGPLKLRTARHWVFPSVDPRSGLVLSTHGGSWRVTGDIYEETVDYGTESQAAFIGKTYKWTVKLEGDTMTKTGIDNPWHEVWKRVK